MRSIKCPSVGSGKRRWNLVYGPLPEHPTIEFAVCNFIAFDESLLYKVRDRLSQYGTARGGGSIRPRAQPGVQFDC
jgi:hypothetical protein